MGNFRNKKTGTVYATVEFNGTGVALVKTEAGSTYTIKENQLEPVNDDTPTQPNDDRKAADELRWGIDKSDPGGDYMGLAIQKGKKVYSYVGEEAEAINAVITASSRQLLQTVLDKLPEKWKTPESDWLLPSDRQLGYNDCVLEVTAIINEIMGGLV